MTTPENDPITPETVAPDATPTPETPVSRRAAASRANGAKSRGPISKQGKDQCTRASLRHGMLARTVVLPNESTERFRALIQQLEEEFQPATPNEYRLVEAMAASSWRQVRAWSLEKSLLSYELRQQALANLELAGEDEPTRTSVTVRHLADNSHSLELINRCEMRFVRQYQRLQSSLLTSRAARLKAAAAL